MPDQPRLAYNDLIARLPATTPFVAPEALERQRGRPFSARLGANESLFGPSPRALDAMRFSLDAIALYGDPENSDLSHAIAAFEGVEPDRIIIGSGIDDLLGLLVRILMNPGDIAVASLGSYATFAYHVAGYGAIMKSIPYHGYRNDLDLFARTARRVKARAVYLANPDNPTGSFYAGSDIALLLERLPVDCALLLDEAYTEFAPDESRSQLPPDDPRLIRLRTFSKAYGMAGARIGYAFASSDLARMVDKVRLHFGVNRIAQAGAIAALRDQAYLDSVVHEVATGRSEYANLARELGLIPLPSVTNFVAIDAGSTERAQAIVRELAKRDIFIRAPGVGLTQLVRVTVGDAVRREEFSAAFREVCAEVESQSATP